MKLRRQECTRILIGNSVEGCLLGRKGNENPIT
jgi:hypothetical protein